MSSSVCEQQTHCITSHVYTTRQPDCRARFLTSLDDVHANLGLNPEEPGMFPSPPFQTTVMMIKKGEFLVNACHRLALGRCGTHFIQWTPTAAVHPLRVFLVCCNIYLFRADFSRDVYPCRNICKHQEINVKASCQNNTSAWFYFKGFRPSCAVHRNGTYLQMPRSYKDYGVECTVAFYTIKNMLHFSQEEQYFKDLWCSYWVY